MMNKYYALALMLLSSTVYADGLSQTEKAQVNKLIQFFQKKDVAAISQTVRYPLTRQAPLPDVDNAKQMKVRFNEVFDAKLIQQIANSKTDQWSSVGWRGIMLDNGEVWFDGEKITAVNYSGTAKQKHKQQLISQQKAKLHSSLKAFKQTNFVFTTPNYVVRIDELQNGNYRYASWKSGQPQSSQPDLIINNGKIEYDGSGGNHFYHFKRGNYTYTVYRNLMGADETSEVSLEVTQNSEVILQQNGKISKN